MSPQQVLTWIATFTLTLISGCANYDSEHHFESNAVAVKASKSTSVHSDRALVYLFRARVLGQSTSIIAFPPMFFAVDGKLVSVMPLGSFVPLSLEPGRHVFSRLIVEDGLFGSIDLKTTDVNVEVVAGKTYYLGTSYGFLAQPFGLVDESRGSQFVGEAELAKFLHQPRTVVAFSAAVVAMEEKRKSSAATNKPEKDRPSQKTSFSAPGLQDALPSSKQVGEFLEVLATVALVSLLVIGSAAGSGSGSSASLPPPDLTPRPAIRQGAAPAVPWRTSSGTVTEIVDSKKERSVYNMSTGVRYRIEDGRVTGTDGSRYRMVGSSLVSDSGQAYQVIGNNVFSSDGRSCVKTGIVISCK